MRAPPTATGDGSVSTGRVAAALRGRLTRVMVEAPTGVTGPSAAGQTVASAGMDLSERGTATAATRGRSSASGPTAGCSPTTARSAPARVLDVGAGDGWFSESLLADLPNAEQVVCWDINYNELELATDDPRVDPHRRSRPSPGFDLVLVLDVLEHIDDPAAVHRATNCARSPRRARRCSSPCPPIHGLFGDHDRALGHYRRYDRRAAARPARDWIDVVDHGPLFPSLVAPRAASVALERLRRVRRRRQRRHGDSHGVGEWHHGPATTRLVLRRARRRRPGATRRLGARRVGGSRACRTGRSGARDDRRHRRPVLRRGSPLRRRRLRAADRRSSTSWCSSTTARPTPRRRCSTSSPRPRRTAPIEVIRLGHNRGKAEAVRAGLRAAVAGGASIVGYFDADLATPVTELERLLAVIDEAIRSSQAVLASRVALLGHSIERKATRHYLGRLYATAASLALGVAVYDTQCGAKLFRRSATRCAAALADAVPRPLVVRRRAARPPAASRRGRAADRRRPDRRGAAHQWRDVGGSKLRHAAGRAFAAGAGGCSTADRRTS